MTKIEWAHAGLGRGKTWNPIRAGRINRTKKNDPGIISIASIGWHCEHVSEGCRNCYAEAHNKAQRFNLGTGFDYKPGHSKDIKIFLDENMLLKPLSWPKPTGIFVCSMTDIFGEWVENKWIDKIFAIAALCPQHKFIIVTKRPERMRAYKPRPLPNVWLLVSVEDQPTADERIPILLDTPAAVRGVSAEPLLGSIILKDEWLEKLSWCIAGGESGSNARPMHPDWAKRLRDQCCRSKTAFFFKQWGAWKDGSDFSPDAMAVLNDGIILQPSREEMMFEDRREPVPPRNPTMMCKVGKFRAGRLLDGAEHNEFPSE